MAEVKEIIARALFADASKTFTEAAKASMGPNQWQYWGHDADAVLSALSAAGLVIVPGEEVGWKDTAAGYARNADYYRGLVVQIGEMFGAAARISDDGSKQDSVLCAKVPDLVREALAARPPSGGGAR